MNTKVVYNACYGGYSLSEEAIELGKKISPNLPWEAYHCEEEIPRHHPILIEVVEKLGDSANGQCAKLKIDIITGKKYRIDEYDGYESVETPESYEWVEIK